MVRKKLTFFKKIEAFLKKYQNLIAFLFGMFGIIYGFYENRAKTSYKNSVEYTTKILDSTIDANGILTVKTIETTLKLNDLKKVSENGDARIRELLAEINKAYKTKNKVIKDTILVSYIQKDTIIKIVRDTIKIDTNFIIKKDTTDSTF